MPRRKKSSHESRQSRSSLSINKDKPQQRYAANARERARMRVLSRAFCRLKTTLPWVPADTKLSKLDTLRLAASYIAHLKGILRDETLGSSESSLHPAMSMTWPFGFNRPLGGSAGGGSNEGGSILGSDEDDEDDQDLDTEDGESISSCTWEEASPPFSVKDCSQLDKAKSRGNSNTRHKKDVSPAAKQTVSLVTPHVNFNSKCEDFSTNEEDCDNSCAIVGPLSQTQNYQPHQNHYQQQQQVILSHFKGNAGKPSNISSAIMANSENAPPPLQHSGSPQNDYLVGVVGNTEHSFLSESFTLSHHQINHGHGNNNNNNEMHHNAPLTFPFGSNDLISIG